MQLFASIYSAVVTNLDKHQFSYLLLFPLLLNMTAAHTQAKTNTVSMCFSFGWFPGVWILFANVSEHPVCSFFLLIPPMKMEQTECTETLANALQTTGNHPKERIDHSEHGESLYQETHYPPSPSLQICTPPK